MKLDDQVTHNGITKSIKDWSVDGNCAVHTKQFIARLKSNWTFDRAFTTRLSKKKKEKLPSNWPFNKEGEANV